MNQYVGFLDASRIHQTKQTKAELSTPVAIGSIDRDIGMICSDWLQQAEDSLTE